MRICGDYKVTVNPELNVDQYPLPRPEDLFAVLAGGKHFTTLDLSQAYNQLKLEESSKPYLTINTHRGLYRYNRLPFGVFCPNYLSEDDGQYSQRFTWSSLLYR